MRFKSLELGRRRVFEGPSPPIATVASHQTTLQRPVRSPQHIAPGLTAALHGLGEISPTLSDSRLASSTIILLLLGSRKGLFHLPPPPPWCPAAAAGVTTIGKAPVAAKVADSSCPGELCVLMTMVGLTIFGRLVNSLFGGGTTSADSGERGCCGDGFEAERWKAGCFGGAYALWLLWSSSKSCCAGMATCTRGLDE